jgi:hypothetical protein
LDLPENRHSRQLQFPVFPSKNLFSIRSHLRDVAAVHRRRRRASSQRRHLNTPLDRASSWMPILRSLGGSAVISLPYGRAMEPRGVSAVQILPLMSSVYRGRNDADRVEEVVSGPPADSAFLPVFLPVDRSSYPLFTRSSHRGITDASYRLRRPAFPRDSVANPLKLHFPSSFPPFARQR